MSWRYHGRASVDPTSPQAFGVCDRCAFLYNLNDLQWQFQFNGTGLINLRLLVCDRCLDVPQPQLLSPVLPPDPMPVFNARPEPYQLDEVDYLATQDGNPIETQSDEIIVTNQPSQNFSEDP